MPLVSSSTGPTKLVEIPCVVYNVLAGSITYPSYSIVGMRPHSISSQSCPRRMQQTGSSLCYAIVMQRDDMTLFTANVHVEGGTDIGFDLGTNLLDNALGIPLTRTVNNTLYTSQGTCFMAQSKILTSGNRAPPATTLGNACRNVPGFGWPCATPLNNPFMTDVMSSPYLLPQGLSATHTHSELSAIFSSTCPSASYNTSGAMMYRNILRNTYANTTPVDFAPLSRTGDIVFITSTSVGFISTKRNTLFDRSNPGYCRPTNMLYCPPGFFGTVGTVCAPCTDTSNRMHGKSVAWQIMCHTSAGGSRRLLSLGQTPPYERLSMVVAGTQQAAIADNLHEAIAQFTTSKAVAPPSKNETFLSPLQQYNMAADTLLQPLPDAKSFIECLIASAENATGRTLFKNSSDGAGAEFTATLISYAAGQPILQSIPLAAVQRQSATPTECYSSMLSKDPMQGWMRCVVQKLPATPASSSNRRLLQQPDAPTINIIEHQGTHLGSNTIISWAAETATTPINNNNNNGPDPTPAASTEAAASSAFPIWAAAIVAAGGVLILLFIVYLLYKRGGSHRGDKSKRKTSDDDQAKHHRSVHSTGFNVAGSMMMAGAMMAGKRDC